MPWDCFVALFAGSGLIVGVAICFCPPEMEVEIAILVIGQPGSVDEVTD